MEQEFAEMQARLQQTLAPMALAFDRFQKLCRFFHFGKSEKDNPVMEKLIAAGKRASGREPSPCGSCQSDLSIFLKYGNPRAFAFASAGISVITAALIRQMSTSNVTGSWSLRKSSEKCLLKINAFSIA